MEAGLAAAPIGGRGGSRRLAEDLLRTPRHLRSIERGKCLLKSRCGTSEKFRALSRNMPGHPEIKGVTERCQSTSEAARVLIIRVITEIGEVAICPMWMIAVISVTVGRDLRG
ncbi:hypothetical protein SKAU_G00385070 [Synaphobranchus kaupii]|uniref:Uncharacterized protein n=1 Tax=Synaphobranchus kaupii TaxID=118154 RepID=A0A9Q1EEE8_SYNKA|nr:hypothetical protein SKAU_G00385070 [Synaphobranchus kaupii]